MYLPKSERNRVTVVRNRLLWFRTPPLKPLHHEDTPEVGEFDLQSYYYYYYYYYLLFREFFIPALAAGPSLESESQQVTSRLWNTFQFSGRSQQYCSLDCLHSSSNFQVLYSLYKSIGVCTERTNNNSYHHHFLVPLFFSSSLAMSWYLSFFSLSFSFTLWLDRNSKVHDLARWSVCISKSQKSLCLIFWDGFRFMHKPHVHMVKFKLLAQYPVDLMLLSGLPDHHI